MKKSNSPEPSGLRDRKRAETLSRIQGEAIRLFIEHGFEATTLDEIAQAAEVSRRSLFHYCESKEEIVLSVRANFPVLLAEAVGRRPAEEPLLAMVENALVEMAKGYESAETRKLGRLIRSTPALNAAEQAKYEKIEQALTKALAERKGLPESDAECRMAAASAIAVLKIAVEAWLAGTEPSSERYFREAFAALRRIAR